MYTLGKSQEGEEYELTVPEALVNHKRKGNIWLLNLCVMFKCVCVFNFYAFICVQCDSCSSIIYVYSIIIHKTE